MMTLMTCGFHGIIRPSVPAPYTVCCLVCRAVVLRGEDTVNLDAFTHHCHDTSSEQREYEITWDTAITEVEVPLPPGAEVQ